ncbi:hypothetical protein Ahy_A05g025003 [Arachis hypogaea]|uniref:Aminotransferase-like plant mobile domain-containing protein n=1 Tax=Arachis hypogaea TaxID=3818 RepID=A0A445D7C6_ARAHY|nr:hypothetical protein Ahy_A05g025003 [Arachis hypogaea]
MRRQQGMPLDERYVPYLQMAGLYHLARLNDRWYRLDEPLVSAFVERWRPEMHTFHMPFGECTITLQDVAYQLGLAVDGHYVSSCLTYFHMYIEGGCPAWVRFEELLGVIPPPSQVQKFAVNCTWFQETFGECPKGADEETVRRFARAYIMMLLGTQLFGDKSGNRIHIRWLPYVTRLEEMGSYSWGSAALAWLYRCICRVANRHVVKLAGPLQLLQSWIFWRFPRFKPARYDTCSWPLASRWSGYSPSYSEKGPRVQSTRLKIDMLQPRDALEPRHTALWRSVTSFIYFPVVEWHLVDRVLPQFGGVQPLPRPALNIDFLMSKYRRGGDRWFPFVLRHWHTLWETRADHVLRFDVVADPGPSHAFLNWWSRHGKRFLSPEFDLGDPRGIPIPVEASQRGPGRVPDMDRVDDVPDRRWVERRARVGRRRSQREWRQRAPVAGQDHGEASGLGGQGHATGDPAAHAEAGLGEVPLGDYFVGVSPYDHTPQESRPWVSPGSTFSDLLAGVRFDGDLGSPFFDDISAMMHDDEAVPGRSQTTGTQAALDVDLNEPPSVSPPQYFALGGTPASALTAGSHSVAGPSSSRPVHVQPRMPAQPAPQDEDEDEIEDEKPLIRRGQRIRVPHRCFTGSHLFR